MNTISILFIAFGLAMDAFAVAIASGIIIKQLKVRNVLKIALFFGLFQAFMPVVGWLAGLSMRDFVRAFDHWVTFGLLSLIGGKMIYESFKIESEKTEGDPLNIYMLLLLSIATSIDALVVGVSFAFLDIFIITPIVTIGIVTFLLSSLGVYIGDKSGHFFENKMEIIGGLFLIGIGVKILIEHLSV